VYLLCYWSAVLCVSSATGQLYCVYPLLLVSCTVCILCYWSAVLCVTFATGKLLCVSFATGKLYHVSPLLLVSNTVWRLYYWSSVPFMSPLLYRLCLPCCCVSYTVCFSPDFMSSLPFVSSLLGCYCVIFTVTVSPLLL
jgi:hypothetical protein